MSSATCWLPELKPLVCSLKSKRPICSPHGLSSKVVLKMARLFPVGAALRMFGSPTGTCMDLLHLTWPSPLAYGKATLRPLLLMGPGRPRIMRFVSATTKILCKLAPVKGSNFSH